MRTIVFATANPNKVREVGASLGPGFSILSLPDIGCTEEIAETALWLCGPGAASVNGQAIALSGGNP